MKRNRKVRILATLGPASFEEETIFNLYKAGADVFRINMSHTDHGLLETLVKRIRKVEQSVNRPIGILADLQGPKLRIGKFINTEEELRVGQTIRLDTNPLEGDKSRVFFPHPEIYTSIKVGDRLLVDDGKVQLKTISSTKETILVEVVSGKKISSNKGVSLPDTNLAIGALTEKDKNDLKAALENEVDWIALSFIQRPEDLLEARAMVGNKAFLMAKIEKPQAVERLSEIIALSDALMVARGDLGVEMPLEQVPGIQKKIVRESRKAGKAVVIATQMLESMITAPSPTRAEVSDISTAVLEGADAIMLSAESASGHYPLEAVTIMNKIAEQVEKDSYCTEIMNSNRPIPEPTEADAIALATREICETLKPSAVVTYTESGATALRISRERPHVPIIALSPIIQTARRLSLVWGTHCIIIDNGNDLEDMVKQACIIASKETFSNVGEHIIVIAGVPLQTPGTTNMLRIVQIKKEYNS